MAHWFWDILEDHRKREYKRIMSKIGDNNFSVNSSFQYKVAIYRLCDKEEELLNWICENRKHRWFFNIEIHSKMNWTIFSFESELDAIHFALRWK